MRNGAGEKRRAARGSFQLTSATGNFDEPRFGLVVGFLEAIASSPFFLLFVPDEFALLLFHNAFALRELLPFTQRFRLGHLEKRMVIVYH